MKKVLIINARYYKDITSKLFSNANRILKSKIITYNISVPGVFEVPVVIKNIKKLMDLLH